MSIAFPPLDQLAFVPAELPASPCNDPRRLLFGKFTPLFSAVMLTPKRPIIDRLSGPENLPPHGASRVESFLGWYRYAPDVESASGGQTRAPWVVISAQTKLSQ